MSPWSVAGATDPAGAGAPRRPKIGDATIAGAHRSTAASVAGDGVGPSHRHPQCAMTKPSTSTPAVVAIHDAMRQGHGSRGTGSIGDDSAITPPLRPAGGAVRLAASGMGCKRSRILSRSSEDPSS